jgi:hypothetical protein
VSEQIYRVQGPDGQIYRLKGPRGASESQIIGALQGMLAEQQLTSPEVDAPLTTDLEDREALKQSILEELGVAQQQDDSAFVGGVKSGIDIVQEATGSTLEGIGRITGAEGLEEYGAEVAERNRLEAQSRAKGEGALGYYAQVLGEQVPQLAIGAAGLGIAALAAPAVVVGAVPAFLIAAGTAALTQIPLFYGLNRQRQKEAIDQGLRTEVNEGAAFFSSIPQAALEGIADKLLFGRFITPKMLQGGGLFTRGVKTGLGTGATRVGGIAYRGAAGAAAGAVAEVPTEIGQQVIERFQAGLDLFSDEAISEYVEAGRAAALVGGTVRGATNILQGDATIGDDERTVDELESNELRRLEKQKRKADKELADKLQKFTGIITPETEPIDATQERMRERDEAAIDKRFFPDEPIETVNKKLAEKQAEEQAKDAIAKFTLTTKKGVTPIETKGTIDDASIDTARIGVGVQDDKTGDVGKKTATGPVSAEGTRTLETEGVEKDKSTVRDVDARKVRDDSALVYADLTREEKAEFTKAPLGQKDAKLIEIAERRAKITEPEPTVKKATTPKQVKVEEPMAAPGPTDLINTTKTISNLKIEQKNLSEQIKKAKPEDKIELQSKLSQLDNYLKTSEARVRETQEAKKFKAPETKPNVYTQADIDKAKAAYPITLEQIKNTKNDIERANLSGQRVKAMSDLQSKLGEPKGAKPLEAFLEETKVVPAVVKGKKKIITKGKPVPLAESVQEVDARIETTKKLKGGDDTAKLSSKIISAVEGVEVGAIDARIKERKTRQKADSIIARTAQFFNTPETTPRIKTLKDFTRKYGDDMEGLGTPVQKSKLLQNKINTLDKNIEAQEKEIETTKKQTEGKNLTERQKDEAQLDLRRINTLKQNLNEAKKQLEFEKKEAETLEADPLTAKDIDKVTQLIGKKLPERVPSKDPKKKSDVNYEKKVQEFFSRTPSVLERLLSAAQDIAISPPTMLFRS